MEDEEVARRWGPLPESTGSQSTMGFDKAVYEFRGAEGETPQADTKLENQLFGEESHVHSGINFNKYDSIKVKVRVVGDIEAPKQCPTFEEMDLHPVILRNVSLARYTKPTPVQRAAIPAVQLNYDLMAHAQTGSGKTAAFLVPCISRLMKKESQLARPLKDFGGRTAEPYVLIVVPTRELANQIFDESRRFCYMTRFRPAVIYGGASPLEQKMILQKGCDILIATPGRLKDFLERGTVSVKKVKTLILDEADRMLDLGFENDIRVISERSGMPDVEERQTLLFSATLKGEVRKLAQDFLKEDFLFIAVGRVGAAEGNVEQRVVWVEDREKRDTLFTILMDKNNANGRTLIFVDTKRMADTIDDYLYNKKLPCTSLHGDRSQREREDALEAFRSGNCPIMIATDVAARGLDIKDVVHVVNFDCPKDIDTYIHRIGRTARAGNIGVATTFYNDRNEMMGPEIVKVLVEAKQVVPDFLQQYVSEDMEYDDVKDEDFEYDENATRSTQPAASNGGGYSESKPVDSGNNTSGGGGGGGWDSGNNTGGGGGGWDSGNNTSGGGGGGWDANPTSSGGGGGGGGGW